jgi:hypothetical protein
MSMSEEQIRLVTRGDDLGSCKAANEAIYEAFDRGILRNTSVMVPAPEFEHGADMFAGVKDMCVGLHITLNAEWDAVKWGPVLPPEQVPSLVTEDGNFYRMPQDLHEREAGGDEMIAEVQAQLDRARAHGLDIRYLDAHCGVTWLDDLEQRARRLAEREGLVFEPRLERLPKPDGAPKDHVERLLACLEAAEPGTYLTVGHPGYYCAEMRRLSHDGTTGDRVAWSRDGQRRKFMDRRVVEYVMTHDIRPTRYDEI